MDSQASKRCAEELLLRFLREWAALYGRKLHQESIDVWMRLFINTPPALLSRALEAVTSESERMPTPGTVKKAIGVARDLHGLGKAPPDSYQFRKAVMKDPERGNDVTVMIDPKEPDKPMFRSIDCPEGRALLASLEKYKTAKQVAIATNTPEKLQEQKVTLLSKPYTASDEDIPF
jgi:hypothetical protein